MLKAAAGGGGRGMRAVAGSDEMAAAFARCQSEALAAFGDGSVFVEKLLARPRHIEVQVLADTQGDIVHLYERDCSVQLRNQKVVEIAPAPGLDAKLRQRILEDAIRLARAAGYVNAGTVEFLVSPERGEHFFIECNPRIQVEHTVTEQVTGIDLVEAQFRIAAGEPLKALGHRRSSRNRSAARLCGSGAHRRGRRRHADRIQGADGARRASRFMRLSGLCAAAAIRSDVRQAHLRVKLDQFIRVGARPYSARARRIPHRRLADESQAAARGPLASGGARRRCSHDAVRRACRPRHARRRAGIRLGLAGAPRTAGDRAARRQSRDRAVRSASGIGRIDRAERRGGRRKPDGGRGRRTPSGSRRDRRGGRHADGHQRDEDGNRDHGAMRRRRDRHQANRDRRQRRRRADHRDHRAIEARQRKSRAAKIWRRYLGAAARRRAGIAGDRASPLRTRFEGSGRSPPACARQADLP